MNKGVVVQLDDKTAYILKNDGGFVSCPRDMSWQVGDVVTLSRYPRVNLRRILIAVAICTSLFLGTGIVLYNIPATYIEVTVNPSVQLTLNNFNRVLNVVGLNEDGSNLIDGISYKNLAFEEAYARLLNRMKNNGYLNNSVIQLIIANDSQQGLDNIEQSLRKISEKNVAPDDKIIMSIKRYANDEYLSLSHPLPVLNIPNEWSDSENNKTSLDDNTDISDEPLIPATIEPSTEDTPSSITPTPTPTEPPNNTPATPAPNMPRHGNWRNGWWDWDCGW